MYDTKLSICDYLVSRIQYLKPYNKEEIHTNKNMKYANRTNKELFDNKIGKV
jgi:hypothetical protein